MRSSPSSSAASRRRPIPPASPRNCACSATPLMAMTRSGRGVSRSHRACARFMQSYAASPSPERLSSVPLLTSASIFASVSSPASFTAWRRQSEASRRCPRRGPRVPRARASGVGRAEAPPPGSSRERSRGGRRPRQRGAAPRRCAAAPQRRARARGEQRPPAAPPTQRGRRARPPPPHPPPRRRPRARREPSSRQPGGSARSSTSRASSARRPCIARRREGGSKR